MRRLLGQYLQAWAASLCLVVAAALAFTILAAAITLDRSEPPRPEPAKSVELRIPGGAAKRPESRPRSVQVGREASPLAVSELEIPRAEEGLKGKRKPRQAN